MSYQVYQNAPHAVKQAVIQGLVDDVSNAELDKLLGYYRGLRKIEHKNNPYRDDGKEE